MNTSFNSMRLCLYAMFSLVAMLPSLADAQMAGDFNLDGLLDADDVNQFAGAIAAANPDPKFDVNNDLSVNQDDIEHWIFSLKNTWIGDFNLDQEWSTSDFVHIFVVGEFEDDIEFNSVFTDGDANGDGEFTTDDFIVIFAKGCEGYEQCGGGRPPRPAGAIMVPEPSPCLTVIGLGGLILLRRTAFRLYKAETT